MADYGGMALRGNVLLKRRDKEYEITKFSKQ